MTETEMEIREMTIDDHSQALALWERTEGIGLSAADSHENIQRYLDRNRGFCFVAEEAGLVIGTILSGHDGRRGYVYHLAVEQSSRKRGIGAQLVDRVLESLRNAGIDRCHLFVQTTNEVGAHFWRNHGWRKRDDLWIFSHDL